MNISVPPDFIEVSLSEFEAVLGLCNWRRDGFGNCDIYRDASKASGMAFGFHTADNRLLVNPGFRKFVDGLRSKEQNAKLAQHQ